MNNSSSRFEALRNYARFLTGNWDQGIILIELLKVLNETCGCLRVDAYLLEKGKLVSVAKIMDEPFDGVTDELAVKVPWGCNCQPVPLDRANLYAIPLECTDDYFGIVVYELPEYATEIEDVIRILAIQASIALKNYNHAMEREIANKIVFNFSSGLDFNQIYPQFVGQLKNIISFDRLTITIPNPFEQRQLYVYGENVQSPLKTRTVSYEGSAPAWVISTGKPILEENLTENRMFPEDHYLFDIGIRSALRVPLMSNGKVIGTLNPGSKKINNYTARHIHLLSEIATRIGPAVQNALVHDKITVVLNDALNELEDNFFTTLNALTYILDKRDSGTKGHSVRVVNYAVAIAESLGIEGSELEDIRLGALLHDIGKIAVPDSILFKEGPLDETEREVIREHPRLGAEIVSKIKFLSPAIPMILHHHEWFNGNGYPDGLAGTEIPLSARLFAIADTFDAITKNRPYREADTIDAAYNELRSFSGTQFCPLCVDAFLRIPRERILTIYKEDKTDLPLRTPNWQNFKFYQLSEKAK